MVLWRLLHLKYSLPLSPVSNHMNESVSPSASFLNPIFAQSVFRIQARIESFSKVSPPDKVSPFFCTAFPARFTVSCKPRYSITAATVDLARISRPTFVRVARLATSFPIKYGNLSAAVASPASAVRVASFGCFPASALVMVVAKFGSLPSAAASSFSVFSASGDESTRAAIAAITKAVFAI